jgi:alkanesulfonate monooxygenase SsuD/methylene tetrahydromethanopterin reductase-like flavin-dependent oxidoreductase (luciferase family)
MTVKLGITLPQFSNDTERWKAAALEAEERGLDSIWMFDHLWPLSGGKDRPVLESWTALAWLAGKTERITIGTLVTRSSLREPALLAKMAATVASIAPGRLIIGIGSGDKLSKEENLAFGITYHAGEDRIDQLRSTVEAVHRYLHQDAVTQHDDFVDLQELPSSPRPSPPPPLWVGGRSDAALEGAASLGDGWNGWNLSPAEFSAAATKVQAMAGERALDLSWGGTMSLTPSDGQTAGLSSGSKTPSVGGDPAAVTAGLKAYVDAGASHLVVTPVGAWDDQVVGLLAEQVRPGLLKDVG